MAGKNLSNQVLNNEWYTERHYKRVGSCDCNGKCCNFIVQGPFDSLSSIEYFRQHGEVYIDRWNGKWYVAMDIDCIQCTSRGECKIFDTATFPEACRQFPINPSDPVWRYLKQMGNSCGFNFIDKRTGRRVDLSKDPSYYMINPPSKGETGKKGKK